MFIFYSMIAAFTTIMVALMGGDIMHISFDTIIHHPDQVNTQKIMEYLGLTFLDIVSIAIFVSFAMSEMKKIPLDAKCIFNNLPLKQTICIAIATLINVPVMTYIATGLPATNINTIPILFMCVELYFIAISLPIKQIVEFQLDTSDNSVKQATA